MGKKGERGAKDKSAAQEEEARIAARRAEHGEEEYVCGGALELDFPELCARAGLQEAPRVVSRPHPPAGAPPEEPEGAGGSGPAWEPREALPALAQIQAKYGYFRPAVQVELEHEDPKSAREVFVRNAGRAGQVPAGPRPPPGPAPLEGRPERRHLPRPAARAGRLRQPQDAGLGREPSARALLLQAAFGGEQVLGPFALTHTEVVERRRLLLEKEAQERGRLPQRHLELKSDRPASHLSSTTIDRLQTAKGAKAVVKKKEPTKKEEKGPVGGAAPAQPPAAPAAQAKKEDAKQSKKAAPPVDPKAKGAKGLKLGSKDKRSQILEMEQILEPTEMMNPLLEPAEHREGQVFLQGNRVLIYLNLMRNHISESGLKAFLATVEYQVSRIIPGGKGPTGLLHLSLAKNLFPAESKTYCRIQELMGPRDPLPKASKPEEELVAAAQ
ncbi:leucine-rich repeat-containing protein 71 isoform 9-T9 [Vipera latastei]